MVATTDPRYRDAECSSPSIVATPPASAWPVAVGLLLGMAAVTVGVAGVVLRPWHALVAVALAVSVAKSTRGFGAIRFGGGPFAFALFIMSACASEVASSFGAGWPIDLPTLLSPVFVLCAYCAAYLAAECGLDRVLFGLALSVFPAAFVMVGQLVSPAVSDLVLRLAPAPSIEHRLAEGRLLRATGLVGHWTGSGFYGVVMLTAVLLLLRRRQERVGHPRLLVACALAAVLVILASFTFAAILTAVCVALSYARTAGVSVRHVTAAIVVSVVAWVGFGGGFGDRIEQQQARARSDLPSWVPSTVAYREAIWSDQTLPAIRENVLLGHGAGVYEDERRAASLGLRWASPESQWLGTTLQYGILVAVALLSAVLLLTRDLRAAARIEAGLRPSVVLLYGTLASSLIVPVFTNRGLPLALWALAGAVASTITRDQVAIGLAQTEN